MEKKLDVTIEVDNGIFIVHMAEWESGDMTCFDTDDLNVVAEKVGAFASGWCEELLEREREA